jgi:DNA-3-methyladenine glycosylase I
MKTRCPWAKDDPDYIKYHDTEWGIPVFDDKILFEFLILEGAQAGLSWLTILKKRENYKKAFDDLDPSKIAKYDSFKINNLLNNKNIIRNKLKIKSAVSNAKAFLKIQKNFGSFSKYIWGFTDGRQIKNSYKKIEKIPAKTKISTIISIDLKKRGFSFVGPVICYSFMQAVGMVNDHLTDCFRYEEVSNYNF